MRANSRCRIVSEARVTIARHRYWRWVLMAIIDDDGWDGRVDGNSGRLRGFRWTLNYPIRCGERRIIDDVSNEITISRVIRYE